MATGGKKEHRGSSDVVPTAGRRYSLSNREDAVLVLTDTKQNKTLIYNRNCYMEDKPFGNVISVKCEVTSCSSWGLVINDVFYVHRHHINHQGNDLSAYLHVFVNILQQASRKDSGEDNLEAIYWNEHGRAKQIQGVIFNFPTAFKNEMVRARYVEVVKPHWLPAVFIDEENGIKSVDILKRLQEEVNRYTADAFSKVLGGKISSDDLNTLFNKIYCCSPYDGNLPKTVSQETFNNLKNSYVDMTFDHLKPRLGTDCSTTLSKKKRDLGSTPFFKENDPKTVKMLIAGNICEVPIKPNQDTNQSTQTAEVEEHNSKYLLSRSAQNFSPSQNVSNIRNLSMPETSSGMTESSRRIQSPPGFPRSPNPKNVDQFKKLLSQSPIPSSPRPYSPRTIVNDLPQDLKEKASSVLGDRAEEFIANMYNTLFDSCEFNYNSPSTPNDPQEFDLFEHIRTTPKRLHDEINEDFDLLSKLALSPEHVQMASFDQTPSEFDLFTKLPVTPEQSTASSSGSSEFSYFQNNDNNTDQMKLRGILSQEELEKAMNLAWSHPPTFVNNLYQQSPVAYLAPVSEQYDQLILNGLDEHAQLNYNKVYREIHSNRFDSFANNGKEVPNVCDDTKQEGRPIVRTTGLCQADYDKAKLIEEKQAERTKLLRTKNEERERLIEEHNACIERIRVERIKKEKEMEEEKEKQRSKAKKCAKKSNNVNVSENKSDKAPVSVKEQIQDLLKNINIQEMHENNERAASPTPGCSCEVQKDVYIGVDEEDWDTYMRK